MGYILQKSRSGHINGFKVGAYPEHELERVARDVPRTDEGVEVVIADKAGWVPADNRKSMGNGLLLVGLLATDWAAELEPVGKRVWARLEIDDVPGF